MTKKKKIAIFHPYLNKFCLGGGGENLIFRMCENLKADLWIGSIDFKTWGKHLSTKDDFVKKLWSNKFKFEYLHKEFSFYNNNFFFLKHTFKLISFFKRFFFLRFSFLAKKLNQYDIVIFSYGNVFFLPHRLKKCKKIVYMHSPVRKLFDQYEYFLKTQPLLLKPIYILIKLIAKRAILKDLKSIDRIITNSENIKKRLKRFFNLSADEVIFPGVESKFFNYHSQGDFFLSYARLDRLKRVSLIVDAFAKMPEKKLIICSHGPLAKEIKQRCSSLKNIEFLGKLSEKKLKELVGKCIAGIYIPIDEDAGITQLEIMSAGKPVIGVKDGGLLETIIDKKTGFLLPKNITEKDIINLVQKTSKKKFAKMRQQCQQQGKKYDYRYFHQKLNYALDKIYLARQKNKICLLTLRSDSGGAPQHLHDLLIRINKKIDCYVATPLNEPFGNKFKSLAKKHFSLKHRYFSFLYMMKLYYFLKNNNINLIHSHGRGAGIYSRLLKVFGFKVIHTFHGIHKENIFKISVDFFLKYLTDQFIFSSNSEVKKAIKFKQTIKKKSIVINNGINLQKAKELFPKKNNKKNTLTIGTLTRLSYQKGFNFLLDYIFLFKKKHSIDFNFLIAGEGEFKQKIINKINYLNLQDCVRLVGHKKNSYEFLASLNIFVSTSFSEAAIPYSVMEAMYCNVPLVISEVSGHEEIKKYIPDSLFKLKSFESFEKVLLDKINNYQKKINSRKIILNNFNADKTAEKINSLYKNYF